MPKPYSSSHIQKVLELLGFFFVSQKGSHGKFKNNHDQTVILPMNKKEISIGTFRSILRQAGITEDIFKKFD
jgi:predicted RNA binding protein YcfA (HicA-like mRNA interferase family)